MGVCTSLAFFSAISIAGFHCRGIFYQPEVPEEVRRMIRIIEAINQGVVRSILDDSRVDDKDVSIYRVSDASSSDKDDAVAFCWGEFGSSYILDFSKDKSSSETDWYCSELVWAAYYNQDIDIETTVFLNEPGVTPRDIKRCAKVESVNFE